MCKASPGGKNPEGDWFHEVVVRPWFASRRGRLREPIGESLQAIGKPAYALLIELAVDASKKEDVRVQALSLLARLGEDEYDRVGAKSDLALQSVALRRRIIE